MTTQTIRGRSGFTLLETLAALALLGVLFATAIPRVSASIRGSRLNRATSVMAMDLELAQSLAARQRTPVRISCDALVRECVYSSRATGAVLHRRPFGGKSEYQLTSLTASPATIEIMPTGLTTAALTVTLGTTDGTQAVSMSRAGQIRVMR